MRRVEINGRSRKVVFIFIFIMKFEINDEVNASRFYKYI